MKPSPRYIGLTGSNGAGKGEAAAFFQKKGFERYSLSDLIREELESEGLESSRDNLIKKGNELRRTYGPDVLARRIMARVKGKAVIDSIRNPEEVRYLKTHKHFLLLAIDAPAEIRFKRVKKRGRIESASSLEEFIAKEGEEMNRDKNLQQLHLCLEMADRTIVNDGSLDSLYAKLEVFV